MDFNSVNNHWWTLKIKLLLTSPEGSLCIQVTQEGGGREKGWVEPGLYLYQRPKAGYLGILRDVLYW